jgi:hypothetical protein
MATCHSFDLAPVVPVRPGILFQIERHYRLSLVNAAERLRNLKRASALAMALSLAVCRMSATSVLADRDEPGVIFFFAHRHADGAIDMLRTLLGKQLGGRSRG